MRSRRAPNLRLRALAVLLTAATVLAAPLGSLAAAGACETCVACDAAVPATDGGDHGTCCAAEGAEEAVAAGDSRGDSSSRGDDCCPPGCTRCCVTQGRATPPAVGAVTTLPDTLVRDSHLMSAPALPPAGVHDSIFHPPRA